VQGGVRPVRSTTRVVLKTDQARQQGAAIQDRGRDGIAVRFGLRSSLRLAPPSGLKRVVTLTSPLGRSCELMFEPFVTDVKIPFECGSKAERGSADFGPGVQARLTFERDDIEVIEIVSDNPVIQAEQFENSLKDSGYDALPSSGHSETIPQNGQTLIAVVPRQGKIVLTKAWTFKAGTYEAWVLAESSHPRLARTRAQIELLADGVAVGSTAATDLSQPSDYWRTTPAFRWTRVGVVRLSEGSRLELQLAPQQQGMGGIAELDALEFVNIDP
jgi:hypothetical protein